MRNSQTPRTDAEAADAANYGIAKGWFVHADFARQLETELAAVHTVRDLAIRIADEATRSDIECLCSRAESESDADGKPWYDITSGPDDDVAKRLSATAVEYLTLRGKIERRGDLVRVAGFDA